MSGQTFQSDDTTAAVSAINSNHTKDAGSGVYAESDAVGVVGKSRTWHGVVGLSSSTTGGFGVWGSHLGGGTGIVGESAGWHGIGGFSKSTSGGAGVYGEGANGPGVTGVSQSGTGIYGKSENGIGVLGESQNAEGLRGLSHNARAGVVGINDWSPAAPPGAGGNGGWFESSQGEGVRGWSKNPFHGGVVGVNTGGGPAVFGSSDNGEGMHAETKSATVAAVAAYNLAPNGTGAAVYAKKEGSIGHAGFFDGEVYVTRSLTVENDVVLRNADCAEEFAVANPELAESGAVMVIGEDGVAGPCDGPYDHRVLGVISGAGGFRPALLLDRQGGPARRPIALMGKVFCLVDAGHGAIRPGDLLTTSATPGHAMHAIDQSCAAGAILGKALGSIEAGCGLIPILAMLQ